MEKKLVSSYGDVNNKNKNPLLSQHFEAIIDELKNVELPYNIIIESHIKITRLKNLPKRIEDV